MLPGIKAILQVALAIIGGNPAHNKAGNAKNVPPPANALTLLPIKPIINTHKNIVIGILEKD
jgi:hypothetical protein